MSHIISFVVCIMWHHLTGHIIVPTCSSMSGRISRYIEISVSSADIIRISGKIILNHLKFTMHIRSFYLSLLIQRISNPLLSNSTLWRVLKKQERILMDGMVLTSTKKRWFLVAKNNNVNIRAMYWVENEQ